MMPNSKRHLHGVVVVVVAALFVLAVSTSPVPSQVLSSSSSSSSSGDSPTVYEMIRTFGLPSGLLPDTVTSYTLHDDGTFVVELPKPCYVQFEYLTYYERRITGHISLGSISNLDGIQVRKFFLWLDVNEIRVDLPPSDSIYFQVGLINRKLDVKEFLTVHSCSDHVSSPCAPSWDQQQHKVPFETLDKTPALLLTE